MPTTTDDIFSVEAINDLIVEPVFATSVVLSSGLLRIDTTATEYHMPLITGGTAGWYDDLDVISEAGAVADELIVRPKKVATVQTVSNEAAADADAASIVGRAVVAALADRVDHAFFNGDGPKGPLGLPAVPFTVVDADPTTGIDPYVDAVAAVEESGAVPGVIFLNPADWADLSKVKSETGSAVPMLNSQPTFAATRSLLGIPVRVSQHVVVGTGWVLDPSRVCVVMRSPASVLVDRSVKFTSDAAVVRGVMRLEFAAPYGGAVAKIEVAGP